MNKVIYKFAFLVSLITLLLCILSGITILTSIERSAIVFLGTLIVIIVFANLLQWGIFLTQSERKLEKKKIQSTEIKNGS